MAVGTRGCPDVFFVCRYCGCDSVSASANVYWDAESQSIQTGDVYGWYCGECLNETGIEEVVTLQLNVFHDDPPKDRHGNEQWHELVYLEELDEDE